MRVRLYWQQAPLWVRLAPTAVEASPLAKVQVKSWIEQALRQLPERDTLGEVAVTIHFCRQRQSQRYNREFRGKDKPTNVLSFPADHEGLTDEMLQAIYGPVRPLGDLIICVELVYQEAAEQGKAPLDHLAHLVMHGVLHLLGHDHEEDQEAQLMEGIEIAALAELGIANPYE